MNMANERLESVWDAEEAAKRFNAPQREIQSLLDGHLAKFNLSALEAISAALAT